MLMDPMGGIVMTNDGNAILREVRITIHSIKVVFMFSFSDSSTEPSCKDND